MKTIKDMQQAIELIDLECYDPFGEDVGEVLLKDIPLILEDVKVNFWPDYTVEQMLWEIEHRFYKDINEPQDSIVDDLPI